MGVVGAEWARDKTNRLCCRRRKSKAIVGLGHTHYPAALKARVRKCSKVESVTAVWQLVSFIHH